MVELLVEISRVQGSSHTKSWRMLDGVHLQIDIPSCIETVSTGCFLGLRKSKSCSRQVPSLDVIWVANNFSNIHILIIGFTNFEICYFVFRIKVCLN